MASRPGGQKFDGGEVGGPHPLGRGCGSVRPGIGPLPPAEAGSPGWILQDGNGEALAWDLLRDRLW